MSICIDDFGQTISGNKTNRVIVNVEGVKDFVFQTKDKEYTLDFQKLLKDYGVEKVEVLDADGVKINVGDIVYGTINPFKYTVAKVESNAVHFNNGEWARPYQLTHTKPVFDANGERLLKGNIVHFIHNKTPFTVLDVAHLPEFEPYGCVLHKSLNGNGVEGWSRADMISRKKPAIDADGNRISVGDTMYGITDGKQWYVTKINLGSNYPVEAYNGTNVRQLKSSWLTHKKPEKKTYAENDVIGFLNGMESYLKQYTREDMVSYGNGMYEGIETVPMSKVDDVMLMIKNFMLNRKEGK